MTTIDEALRAAQAYFDNVRPGAKAIGLLEDETDYLVRISEPEEMVGAGLVFVAKVTGRVWQAGSADQFDKMIAMTPVTGASPSSA